MDTERGTSTRDGRIGVLHLVSTFAVKTDTKWLVQLARHMDPGRYRLSAACFYGGGPMQAELASLGVETSNFQIADERDPRAILRARDCMTHSGCDVVHTHLLRADLLGGAAARWARVGAIVSTVYAIGDYRRATRRRSDWLLDAACARLPTHVVAVSEAVRRDCVDRQGFAADRVSVIHTGIEPPASVDPFAVSAFRQQYAKSPDSPLVVVLARLSYEKGVDTLIDAAAVLRQTHRDTRIVVLGDGPDRAALEARIGERGVGGAVALAGHREDVWPALAAADVVCLPSKSEGMPNALLEAMAMSRPVVATSVGGIPEAITHEQEGLLVEPDAPAALAAALGRVVGDGDWARRMGLAARRRVDEQFAARAVARRYGEMYASLLGRRLERREEPAGVGAA
jgi:glycosyltransferase involved in cell wall biosynthesis